MNRSTAKMMSAAQLASKLAGDETIKSDLLRHRQATQLSGMLAETRVRKGLRQKDIAVKMGVSESTVSRIEDAVDAELRLGDVIAYARALELELILSLEDSELPAKEQIRHCVCHSARLLRRLATLAKQYDDKMLAEEVNRFRSEILLNYLTDLTESEYPFSLVMSEQPQQRTKRVRKKSPIVANA